LYEFWISFNNSGNVRNRQDTDFNRINCLTIPTARWVLPTPCGPMKSKPNGGDIRYFATKISPTIFSLLIFFFCAGMMSKFSSSQCSYRCGIFAFARRRSAREPLIQSQRTTPSMPSRETRTQPVSAHAEHIHAFYNGE